MTIPHYINEDRSELWPIKSGWHAMDDNGTLRFIRLFERML